MKNLMMTLILMLAGCQTASVNTQHYLQDAQTTSLAFTQQLGATLKQQIQSQGVASAIPFCKEVAPAIAKQYSTETKTVIRVSNKARNRQQGIPDAWEEKALAQLEQQAKQTPADAPLEYAQLNTENGVKHYRYVKAIKVQAMCLKCHGQPQDIISDVLNALDKHYPNDVARGYKEGDIRGAVSIKYKLN